MKSPATDQLRVTFDTNVCALLHEPERYAVLMPIDKTRRVWQAISEGQIKPFISEATIFVECLSFPDKLRYLSVAGTRDLRPTPDPRSIALFRDLALKDFRCLHAPLIATEKFDENFEWAEDDVYPAQTRHIRFSELFRKYPGVDPLRQLGQDLLKGQPPIPPRSPRFEAGVVHFEIPQSWAIAIERAWNEMSQDSKRKQFKKKVGSLISNWCDSLAVASHFGYGNDVFCTFDEGKGSGQGGPLHYLNRGNLSKQGVHVKSPLELLGIISSTHGSSF